MINTIVINTMILLNHQQGKKNQSNLLVPEIKPPLSPIKKNNLSFQINQLKSKKIKKLYWKKKSCFNHNLKLLSSIVKVLIKGNSHLILPSARLLDSEMLVILLKIILSLIPASLIKPFRATWAMLTSIKPIDQPTLASKALQKMLILCTARRTLFWVSNLKCSPI